MWIYLDEHSVVLFLGYYHILVLPTYFIQNGCRKNEENLYLEIRTKCPTPTANDMNCCGYMVMWYKIFYERKMTQFGFLFFN